MRDVTEKQRIAALLRRVKKARDFPANTCPASRHLHIMAEALAKGRAYPMFTEEPLHCAETMLAVLASLWELRAASPEYKKQVESEVAKMGYLIDETKTSHEESTSR